LREQVRGKNTRAVYTGRAARELGIEPTACCDEVGR
jgi:hypothetical protein